MQEDFFSSTPFLGFIVCRFFDDVLSDWCEEVWIKGVALKHIHYHVSNKIASGNLLYDSGRSNPVLHDNLEGWDGVGSGRDVPEGGDISIPMAHSC